MKLGQYEVDNKWLMIGGAVLVVIIVLIILIWPTNKPSDTQQILNAALVTAQAPLLAQIEVQKQQVADYKNQLIISDGKYQFIIQKYNVLQREKENVKPPSTNKELRDRFTALNYVPLSVK
jgi:hypothetical protein